MSAISPVTPARLSRPMIWLERLWRAAMWILVSFFLVNVLAIVTAVVVNSFGSRWQGTWLPAAATTRWYASAWMEFSLDQVLTVTGEITALIVGISLAIGVPAAYALARREFRLKRYVMLLFLLPLLVPPISYGIPLATVLYRLSLGGTLWGVVAANLVPAVPFVVLVMTPFIEQIDPRLESAARVLGAGTGRIFIHVLAPLLAPGILAAGLLVTVRTLSMFELTFLTSGPESQTLVVALYYSVFAGGVRASQSIDAMAVMYMSSTLFFLIVALCFVNPTQLVTRVKEQPRATW